MAIPKKTSERDPDKRDHLTLELGPIKASAYGRFAIAALVLVVASDVIFRAMGWR